MLTKSRVVQLLFMLTILVGLFFWKTFSVQQDAASSDKGEIIAPVNILRCNYEKSCEFVTEQGSYLLSIKNMPIQAEQWIDFELNVPIGNVTISKAQITGKTMFMGRIPIKFSQSASQQFSAKGIVGSCTADNMIWELQITVAYDDKQQLLTFDFMVK